MESVSLALWLSLQVAVAACLIDLLLALPLAYVMARRRFPGRELLDSLLTLPMVLPPTVLGYYLLVVLGRHGSLGGWLWRHWQVQLLFTLKAAVIAAAVVVFPLIFKPLRQSFAAVEVALEEQALTLGLSPCALWWRVTLPLAMPGLLSACLLGGARAMGEFGATLMVAGNLPGETQTLSLAIYEAVQAGDDAGAQQRVLLALLVGLALMLAASWWWRRSLAAGVEKSR